MSGLPAGDCPACDGDGEIYVGSAVPDDEGYAPCSLCGGSGKTPTAKEIAALRERALEAEGDLQAARYEVEQWKGRARELERFAGLAEGAVIPELPPAGEAGWEAVERAVMLETKFEPRSQNPYGEFGLRLLEVLRTLWPASPAPAGMAEIEAAVREALPCVGVNPATAARCRTVKGHGFHVPQCPALFRPAVLAALRGRELAGWAEAQRLRAALAEWLKQLDRVCQGENAGCAYVTPRSIADHLRGLLAAPPADPLPGVTELLAELDRQAATRGADHWPPATVAANIRAALGLWRQETTKPTAG